MNIYNTLTKQKEGFKPITPGKISLYVCGITVYDHCHLGHARLYVAFDMVVRFFRMQGWDVTYVRNITDIDDKIIKRARENNEDIATLTARYIDSMDEDMGALGVARPDKEPRATLYIQEMLDLIHLLVDKGIAYVGTNSDVYFRVDRFPAYGELAHKSLDKLQSGARVDIELAKESPLDFVLWKQSKAGEPAWDSPWGPGRPGWHIECSAMAMKCLAPTIDIHGGGSDLKFPHHENERAQSEGATGQTFVNTWMHVGFVQVDKEKMSKSLNNFFTIKQILTQYDGEVIRYFLLASHYRSPVNYSEESLILAKNALTTLYTALRGIEIPIRRDIDSSFESRFVEVMLDDFNTPEALVILFELAHELNIARSQRMDQKVTSLAYTLKKLANSLGFLERDPELFLQGENGHLEIEQLLVERKQAREARNWARADEIRQMLDDLQIVIEDTKEGTLWRRK